MLLTLQCFQISVKGMERGSIILVFPECGKMLSKSTIHLLNVTDILFRAGTDLSLLTSTKDEVLEKLDGDGMAEDF